MVGFPHSAHRDGRSSPGTKRYWQCGHASVRTRNAARNQNPHTTTPKTSPPTASATGTRRGKCSRNTIPEKKIAPATATIGTYRTGSLCATVVIIEILGRRCPFDLRLAPPPSLPTTTVTITGRLWFNIALQAWWKLHPNHSTQTPIRAKRFCTNNRRGNRTGAAETNVPPQIWPPIRFVQTYKNYVCKKRI